MFIVLLLVITYFFAAWQACKCCDCHDQVSVLSVCSLHVAVVRHIARDGNYSGSYYQETVVRIAIGADVCR